MNCLFIHSSRFEYIAKSKTKLAQKISKDLEKNNLGNCLVCFLSFEESDSENEDSVAQNLAFEIQNIAEQINERTIVLYPYAHLLFGKNPSQPETALKIMEKTAGILGNNGFSVSQSPFGWYKSFTIECKGHPLSELSRQIGAKAVKVSGKKERKKGSEFSRFVAVDLDGKTFEIDPENIDSSEIWENKGEDFGRLKQFIMNELQGSKSGKKPKHIEYMQSKELVDYCDVSEAGNYKWYPKGVLIRRLLLEYARRLARNWGAFEMVNPLIIRGDNNTVGVLLGEFHERNYRVDGGRGTCYLRYASDPLGFPFMQNVKVSYKQTPLKVYEEASCFRNEQEGEVSGLKRVRNFLMTDMHAACKDSEEAKIEFEKLCFLFGDLMNDIIAKGRWVLGWEGTVDFFERNKDWLVSINKRIKVPAFFKLSEEMSHYYVMKNEYQTILEDTSNIQVSTVQWDVKDGPRFDIGFIDKDSKKKPFEVIIHASSFGSIERTMCSILENIAIDETQGKPPMFQLWLSPAQVRLCPVSNEKHLEFCKKLADFFANSQVRVDIDDSEESVSKKIVNASKDWVPFTLVIGDKELASEMLSVRLRTDSSQKQMTRQELITEILEKTKGMPFLPYPLPRFLSQQPKFR